MRTKVTLVLIFLNVALFFFIFKFERNWRVEAASKEARRRVFGPEAADIRSLDVFAGPTAAGATPTFSLERRRDTWFVTQPLEWPANPHAASAIVLQLQLLEHETAFSVSDLAKNNLSLADYGLEKPKMVVAFSSLDPAAAGEVAPPKIRLRIGDLTKDGKRLYVLSPDRERVHIVNRSLADTLSTPLEQLRADSLLGIRVFEARSLSIVQTASADPAATAAPGSGSGIRVRIRKDGTRWTFESPHTARASKTAVELAINELNALRATSFPASGPSPATAPVLRITIEGNNRHETLFIGEPVSAPSAASASSSTPPSPSSSPPFSSSAPSPTPVARATTEYFAQLEGRSALFTVALPPSLLATLRTAQTGLRETRILDFDAGAVAKIELSSPAQPNQAPLTLQRLEPPAGQAANLPPPWQLVQRGAGEQGPKTVPADRAAVQRLLDQLALLDAKTFQSDAPTSSDLEEWGFNQPFREIALTLAGHATPLVLRIGVDAGRSMYYARVGTPLDPGTSIYRIGPEIERELPLSPLAWRDRSVTDPLAATARIAALKLTDLQSKEVLFETTFTAAGEPSAAPRDPKAVQDLVAMLRAPRAREFLPGGFAERIAAAGDERPWRFQLDATVTLPGAGGAEQTSTSTYFFTERLGGPEQFAGSKEHDVVFSLEQPVVDALWSLAYGARDPGPGAPQR